MDNEKKNIIIDDFYATRVYVSLMGDRIARYGSKVYFFNSDTGLWENNKDMFLRSVSNMQDKLKLIDQSGRKDKIIDYSSVGRRRIIYKILASQLIDKGDIRREIENTSEGKILFSDGIYDTITNTFTQGFNRNIVFSDRINEKFNIDLVPQ